MKKRIVLIALIGALVVSGCQLLSLLAPEPTPSPAIELMPDLEGYTVVEGETLLGYINSLGEGAALLAGRPELAASLEIVDKVISCYEEIGAVQARLYSNTAVPLSAGAVAIADRDALEDPLNLLRCVGPSTLLPGEASAESLLIHPCTASYTLTKDGNELYILYAGSTLEICEEFCAALEGCTEHSQ